MRRPPPHTLRGQLTAGLVLLLAAACLAVGLTTVFALEGFLVRRLDQQLTASGGRFAASLEHEATPDTDNRPDSRGQADQTFGARLLNGQVTQAAVVDEQNVRQVPLTRSDRQTLQEVPADGRGRSVRLSGLGSFRVSAVPGDDQDVLITGLPLHPVEETLHRLEGVEGVVFGAALLATAVAGAFWVRISLRPCNGSRSRRSAWPGSRWPAARLPCPIRCPSPTLVPKWDRSAPR